ncbi:MULTISPECIES: hypothetical protein [unclassified Arthrobacter]|uniref:hypothetical protein n=1 Tax=unclassified Arthrobacter TaxID=235627 RepID=UPI00288352C3|nr:MULTISPECIES: hypothetical protein [unclassified Arthrobacter]
MAGPEGVPGLGNRVLVTAASSPLVYLGGHEPFPGGHVHPFQRYMAGVAVEDELVERGAADGVAAPGQHHAEQQLEQDRLAAAVLQQQQRERRRPPREGVEQAPRRDLLPEVGQVNGDIGVAGTAGANAN